MRGSLVLGQTVGHCQGIIPAHAGLTRPKAVSTVLLWDHPRACGAHRQKQLRGILLQGSSPRMRGSLTDRRRNDISAGIIPAHAGLTSRITADINAPRDHPRACGAHRSENGWKRVRWGSSPRMRGSLSSGTVNVRVDGIIPAHAGLTYAIKKWNPEAKDHPRACGAHGDGATGASCKEGSSPRMRGSHIKI